MYRDLTDVYISSQKQDETHAALPFLDFLVQICQGSQAGGQAVLDAGLLDLIVSMMVRDFSIPSLGLKKDDADERRSMVFDVCQSLLMHLSAHPDLLLVMADHPICALWPKHHLFHKDLAVNADARWRKRRLAWNQVDQSLVNDRLKTAPALCEMAPEAIRETADLEDLCVDLLEFLRYVMFFLSLKGLTHVPCSGPDVYGWRVSSLARVYVLECIELGGRRCEVLADVLSSSSYEENSDAFKNIISYCSCLRYVPTIVIILQSL
jgi:hypothetical protein